MEEVRCELYSKKTHSIWMDIGTQVAHTVCEQIMVVIGVDAIHGNNVWRRWVRSIVAVQVENEIDFVYIKRKDL